MHRCTPVEERGITQHRVIYSSFTCSAVNAKRTLFEHIRKGILRCTKLVAMVHKEWTGQKLSRT